MKAIKQNRCFECNKKIFIIPIKCKCQNIFCSIHRYAEKHNCSYNYKEFNKQYLTKTMPLNNDNKIYKI